MVELEGIEHLVAEIFRQPTLTWQPPNYESGPLIRGRFLCTTLLFVS